MKINNHILQLFPSLIIALMLYPLPGHSKNELTSRSEILHYGMFFCGIPAGAAELSWTTESGFIELEAKVKTNFMAGLVFSLDNVYITRMDSSSGQALSSYKYIRQANLVQEYSEEFVPGEAQSMNLFSLLHHLRTSSFLREGNFELKIREEGIIYLAKGQTSKSSNDEFFEVRFSISEFGGASLLPESDLLHNHIGDSGNEWLFRFRDSGVRIPVEIEYKKGILSMTMVYHGDSIEGHSQ